MNTGSKIRQYVKTTPFDKEAKESTWQFIREAIDDFESRGTKGENWEPKSFRKETKAGKTVEDTFYCKSLCGYGHSCKYIASYNEELAEKKKRDDSFEDLF